ncbi:LysR family transcriptional regulator [Roseovarius sp.]|uniref:LysR family transcriptional regulator n=1 Tax=Roseovarius sp. TaxID=1486281 RepID=UPI003A9869ED
MTNLHRLVSSPKSLLVFEAAARQGSFSRAAQAFNISQPSVSRNIAQLEAEIGQPLFVRGAKGAVLTDAGKALFIAVSEGFGRISDVITQLQSQQHKAGRDVVLSLSNAFVTNWLGPRFAEFVASFPDVVLRFELLPGTRVGLPEDVDLASCIRDEAANDPVLAPEIIIPVCSPAYLAQHGMLLSGAGGEGHVFLHLSDHPSTIWEPMLGPNVQGTEHPGTWYAFSDYAAIMQAAVDGTGIALGWVNVVAGALRAGRLVPAWQGGGINTGRCITLVSTRAAPVRPVVREIAQWLCARMAEDIVVLARDGLLPDHATGQSATQTVGVLSYTVE